MRWAQVTPDGALKVKIRGLCYDVPTICRLDCINFKRVYFYSLRARTPYLADGYKLGKDGKQREKLRYFTDKDYYKIGKQLCKV